MTADKLTFKNSRENLTIPSYLSNKNKSLSVVFFFFLLFAVKRENDVKGGEVSQSCRKPFAYKSTRSYNCGWKTTKNRERSCTDWRSLSSTVQSDINPSMAACGGGRDFLSCRWEREEEEFSSRHRRPERLASPSLTRFLSYILTHVCVYNVSTRM